MAKSLRRICVNDAVVRKNLGTFCYMDKPVLVVFRVTHMPVKRDAVVLTYC